MASQIKDSVESIVIYIDITSKYLEKRDIIKSIELFASEKLKLNVNCVFSAFYYQEGATPTFVGEFKNGKDLVKRIDQDFQKREKGESFFENGMFFCLSYLAEKAVKSPGTFRVIVISDLPSNRNAEYTEALMNLVESVRNFPTFVDIIRIGQQRFYKDDVKLRIISTLTNGGLFYLTGRNMLKNTLVGLAKNKTLPALRPEGGQFIDDSQKMYYEGLAKTLISPTVNERVQCQLCKRTECNYCNNPEDPPLKCPQCGFQYHECCAALYSWRVNVGFKHIFRCVGCGILLRLNEDNVIKINSPEIAKEEPHEVWKPPVEAVKEETGKIGPDQTKNIPNESEKSPIKISKRTKSRASATDQRRVCPICSNILKPGVKVCPECGYKLP